MPASPGTPLTIMIPMLVYASHTNVDSFVNKIEPNVVFNQAPMPVDALTQQGVVLTNNSDTSLLVFCVFSFLFDNCFDYSFRTFVVFLPQSPLFTLEVQPSTGTLPSQSRFFFLKKYNFDNFFILIFLFLSY